jgi:glutamate formiminotransferase
VGARKPLVAFNVNLDTDSVETARAIARAIRYSSGGLDHVQAIGIRLADRGIVQVSTNLTDCEATPIVVVFEAIQKQANALGVDILESELVGLMPKAALAGTTAEYCRIRDFSDDRLIEYHHRDA